MVIGRPIVVWCEPIKRGELKVATGDIAKAMTWFKETTGQDAKLIVLHHKNERYAKEAGETVEVKYLGGCLQWEVWLSAEDGSTTVLSHLDEALESMVHCDKKKKHTNARVGRPYLDLPSKRIQDFVSQGLSCRVIASKLQAEGINVSYRSVHRVIKKLQGELPIFSP